ncbi:hypothetical protein QOT17_018367 [Balamuthia mandrillaris]
MKAGQLEMLKWLQLKVSIGRQKDSKQKRPIDISKYIANVRDVLRVVAPTSIQDPAASQSSVSSLRNQDHSTCMAQRYALSEMSRLSVHFWYLRRSFTLNFDF